MAVAAANNQSILTAHMQVSGMVLCLIASNHRLYQYTGSVIRLVCSISDRVSILVVYCASMQLVY